MQLVVLLADSDRKLGLGGSVGVVYSASEGTLELQEEGFSSLGWGDPARTIMGATTRTGQASNGTWLCKNQHSYILHL